MSALSSLSSATASSLLGTLQPPPLSVSGLVSGLDTNKIIDGLLALPQSRIQLMHFNQQKLRDEETAFKSIEAKLLGLSSQASQLARTFNGPFDARTVTSSNQDLLTAAGSSSAATGVYTLQVNSLARAEQLVSQGFDSPNTTITQGTIQVRVGTGTTATITIDNSNNTLQGLASAINNAGAAVTATVLNDGSGDGKQAYRLLLTAKQSGASNAISITNNLAADGAGAVKPVLDTNYIGQVNRSSGYTGTSNATANSGAAGYTGTTNNTYTFTVVNGGTVGTDSNLQISYRDSTGTNTGTITLNSADVGVFKNVAQGLKVQFGAGTLVAGQSFSIKAYTPVAQQAADASVTIGSGSGVVTVQSATNQIDNLITGVTLNLQAADSSKPVTLTVANDTGKAKQAITDFVKSYNDLTTSINQQITYDPETQRAGPLLGNSDLIQIQDQTRSLIGGAVNGINPLMNRFGALGIKFDNKGQLTVDQAKLDAALAGQVNGVTPDAIKNVFQLAATSTNPAVQFISGTGKTQESSTPYQVNVTQAATRAFMSATNALAASTVIDGTNDTFTITIDGTTSSAITLTHGTYTPQALAQEVQTELDSAQSLVGRKVSVSVNGGKLAITSNTYGSFSQVTSGTGSALNALGLTGTESGRGQDVTGNFIVNGVVEPARGTGQFLQGVSTNAHTADLQIRVLVSQAQIGTVANLTVTRGIASKLDNAIQSILDPISGRLKTVTDGFNAQVKVIQDEIDRANASMQTQRDSLVRQFSAMEATVSSLQSASSFLSAQAASLVKK